MKWFGYLGAILLIISCFMKWVVIQSRNIVVTGIESAGTTFGKPAFFHFILVGFFLVFHSVPKVWAKRANLVVVAVNLGWAVRNYFMISLCRGGDCPEKHAGIYLILVASVMLLLAGVFPDVKKIKAP